MAGPARRVSRGPQLPEGVRDARSGAQTYMYACMYAGTRVYVCPRELGKGPAVLSPQ